MYKKQRNSKTSRKEKKAPPSKVSKPLPLDPLAEFNILTTRPVQVLEHKEQFRRVHVNESIRDSIQRVYDPKIFATPASTNLHTQQEPPANPPNTTVKHSLQTQVIQNTVTKNNTTANRLEVHEIVTKMTHNKLA